MTKPSKIRRKKVDRDEDDKVEFGTKETDSKPLMALNRSQEAARERREALGSAPTSIRLPKDLIEKLKSIARRRGMPYQTYVRMVLIDHVEAHGRKTG
jgi:predicted DNA binding CopG/RHH family protein